MRRAWLLLGCSLPVAFAATMPHGVALLDMQSSDNIDGPHLRFTPALSHVKEQFTNITAALEQVEDATGDHGDQSMVVSLPMLLRGLSSGIATLRRVRSEVAATSNDLISANVRMQVVWDIDRCAPACSHPPAVDRALPPPPIPSPSAPAADAPPDPWCACVPRAAWWRTRSGCARRRCRRWRARR